MRRRPERWRRRQPAVSRRLAGLALLVLLLPTLLAAGLGFTLHVHRPAPPVAAEPAHQGHHREQQRPPPGPTAPGEVHCPLCVLAGTGNALPAAPAARPARPARLRRPCRPHPVRTGHGRPRYRRQAARAPPRHR